MEGWADGTTGVIGGAKDHSSANRQRLPRPDCYQMLCCGRNRLDDGAVDATVAGIRELSNPQARATGVTGVVAFNGRQFVQLIEGPRDGVETMFNTLRTIAGHSEATHIVNGPVGYAACWDWLVVNIAPDSLASRLLALALSAALDGSNGHIARLTWFMVGLEGTEQGAGFGARLLAPHQRTITGYP